MPSIQRSIEHFQVWPHERDLQRHLLLIGQSTSMENLDSTRIVEEHQRRNRTTVDASQAFQEHRSRVTSQILEMRRTDDDRLCLLGAGNCNDVDLNELASNFRQITLVDIDRQAVEFGLARQSVHSAAHHKFNILAPYDVCGLLSVFAHPSSSLQDRYSRILEVLKECGPFLVPREPSLATSPMGPHQLDLATHDEPANNDNRLRPESSTHLVDCIASCCLMSQLVDTLHMGLGQSAEVYLPLVLGLRKQHLKRMHATLIPGGRGVMFIDFVSSQTLPELARVDSSSIAALLFQALQNKNFFTGLNPFAIQREMQTSAEFTGFTDITLHSPWKWDIGGKQFGVAAISFTKR